MEREHNQLSTNNQSATMTNEDLSGFNQSDSSQSLVSSKFLTLKIVVIVVVMLGLSGFVIYKILNVKSNQPQVPTDSSQQVTSSTLKDVGKKVRANEFNQELCFGSIATCFKMPDDWDYEWLDEAKTKVDIFNNQRDYFVRIWLEKYAKANCDNAWKDNSYQENILKVRQVKLDNIQKDTTVWAKISVLNQTAGNYQIGIPPGIFEAKFDFVTVPDNDLHRTKPGERKSSQCAEQSSTAVVLDAKKRPVLLKAYFNKFYDRVEGAVESLNNVTNVRMSSASELSKFLTTKDANTAFEIMASGYTNEDCADCKADKK